MKELNYNKNLIGYALSFVSFILPKLQNVKEIILFGSVAREEANEKSDIDLFLNVDNKNNEEDIKESLRLETDKFYKSRLAEVWLNKGIKNPIKIQVGKLNEWKLKRSIISDGIVLYSKYRETPEKLKAYIYFNLEPIKILAKRNKIIRAIFGRNEKGYNGIGLLKEVSGKKQSLWSFFVPLENSGKIKEFLDKERVSHKIIEIWTDQIF